MQEDSRRRWWRGCLPRPTTQTKKPRDESRGFRKWRLPTLPRCNFRSPIGDAVSLPVPLFAALVPPRLSPSPAPSPARRRRAHRRPPRASDALRERYGATRSWDIKDMVSLKKVSLSFSSDHWAHEVIVELVASWEV